MAKKRGHNQGSVYKHKATGKWCSQVTIQGPRLTEYFSTQKEGFEWIQEMRLQIDRGLTFEAAKLKMSDYLKYWLDTIQDSIKQTTWIDYRQGVKNHILPNLGDFKVKDIKPIDIQLLINRKKEEGLSAWRLQYIKRILNKALNQAVLLGIIPFNPVKGVTVPRPPKREMNVWNKDQVKIFLASLEETRFEAFYYVAFTTGLRQGELLGLHWNDLDWKNKTLSIKRQLRRVREKGVVFEELKNKHSQRVIVLSDIVITKMESHQEHQKKMILFAGDRWKDKEKKIIFPSTIGTPWTPRNCYRHFQEGTKKLELPKIRFHDIRHTAATLMFKENIHPKVVQEILGHASIVQTLDTYSHVIPSMQEEVAETLNRLFS